MPQDSTVSPAPADRRRFLIVVGLAKSGTTFLHDQFGAQPAHFNLPVTRKEIDYFRSGQDTAHYLAFFGEAADPARVHVDASPLYVDDIVATLGHATACLAGHQVQAVICLRAPFERAYSHYLHDVAQNLPVVGQGAYNLYDPAVLGKYFYPLAPRVRHMLAVLGRDAVHGFSFAADNGPLEGALRAYAGLPGDWGFDYRRNPAPGFTSPQVFYDAQADTVVSLRDGLYRLPRGQMLMVSRQFSQLYPRIAPRIGQAMLAAQASITRAFDVSRIPRPVFDRIRTDYEEACALLDIAPAPEAPDAVYISQLSDTIPERLLPRLERIGQMGDCLAGIFDHPLRSSDEAILAMPGEADSVAKCMAGMSLAARRKDDGSRSLADRLAEMEARHGLPPDWMDGLIRQYVIHRRFDALESMLARYGGARGLFRATDIRPQQAQVRPPLTADEIERLAALGLTVQRAAPPAAAPAATSA